MGAVNSPPDRPSTFDAALLGALPHLHRYAYVLMRGDFDNADELVNDTVVRALTYWRSWVPDSDLRAWLFTVMHNLYVDWLRRGRGRLTTVDISLFAQVLADDAPHQRAVDVAREFAAILRRFKPRVACLLVLAADGADYEEMADEVGIPVGTVRSRLSRARAKARRLVR